MYRARDRRHRAEEERNRTQKFKQRGETASSPTFRRGESHRPIITESQRGEIKSTGCRRRRLEDTIRDSSSKIGRFDEADMIPRESPRLFSLSSRQHGVAPSDDFYSAPSIDPSGERKVFDSRRDRHRSDQHGYRNVVSRALNPPSHTVSAPALPSMRDYRRFVEPPGLARVIHSAKRKYGAGAAIRSGSTHHECGARGGYAKTRIKSTTTVGTYASSVIRKSSPASYSRRAADTTLPGDHTWKHGPFNRLRRRSSFRLVTILLQSIGRDWRSCPLQCTRSR